MLHFVVVDTQEVVLQRNKKTQLETELAYVQIEFSSSPLLILS